MADSDSSADEWSDDEYFDNIGEFDLLDLNENDRQRVQHVLQDLQANPDNNTGDVDFFEDYEVPEEFVWSNVYHVQCVKNFVERPGPVRRYDTTPTPLELFQLFYSDQVFEHIVTCTNANAQRKRTTNPDENKGPWTDVTMSDIKTYYGVVLMMDIHKMDRDEMYFREPTERHFMLGTKIPKVITKDRFFQIRRYLHFNIDNVNGQDNDKLFKVRFMLDTIRQAFKSEYIPHEQVSVDESMVPFKGRLGFKQYMKDKPVKFGVKMWMAADSITAYCWNFDVYVGKHATQINRIFGLSAQVVIDLTKDLAGKGHTIYTDNFYTSPKLAHFLSTKDIYICGTMRTNRIGYPKDIVKSKSEARRLPRGFYEWRQCESMVATSWKDNKMVYFLSTAHVPEQENLTTSRRNKDGTEEHLDSTPTVHEYCKYMGGVDRNDQMTKLNKSKKSMRWYRKIERKLLEMSVYNSYIIEGTLVEHDAPGKRKRDLLSYKLDLAHALVGTNRLRKRSVGRARSENSANLLRLDNMAHYPAVGEGKDHVCVVCNERHNRFKRSNPNASYNDNPHKRCKTTIMCTKCGKYLCCNTKKMCFTEYHTMVNL